MAQVKFANNGKTTLNGAINSSVTTIEVTDGSVLPSLSGGDWFYLTLEDNSLNREIVKVTARSTNTLTVVRGQDGTTAASWATGVKAENRLTLAALNEMAAAVAGITPSAFFLTLVDDASAAAAATTLGLGTGDSPRFGALYIGADTDLYIYESATNALTLRAGTTGTETYLTLAASAVMQLNGSTVWTAGNDGPGSTLDADTLDGYQAANFGLLASANNWTSYQAITPAGDEALRIIRTGGYISFYNTANNDRHGYILQDATGLYIVNEQSGGVAITGTTSLTYNGNTVWHAGNDGPGSTLDADTLDGFNSNKFMGGGDYASDSVAGGVADLNVAHPNGHYTAYAASNLPTADWWTWINVRGSSWASPNEYGWQLANNLFNSDLRHRNYSNGVYGSWNKIWHAGNDGAGSGLDADLLDGYNIGTSGVAIPLLSAANTWGAEQRLVGPYIGGSASSYRGISDVSNAYASAGAILVWGGVGDEHTYLSSRTGQSVYIRANGLSGTDLIISASSLTWGGVAVPTISSTDTLSNKTLSSPTLSGTVAGIAAFSNVIIASSTSPEFRFTETDAVTDEGQWRVITSAGDFYLQALNDAYSAATTPMQINRTGTTIDSIALVSTALTWNGVTIWAAGNDGAGSGLDADLWDGNQFATYLNQALLTTSSPTFNTVNADVVTAVAGFSATSGNSYAPQINLFNTNNDASGCYLIFNKHPADATVTAGDNLGTILWYGRGSSSLGMGVQMLATSPTAARGTTWVEGALQIGVMDTVGTARWTYFHSNGTVSSDALGTFWGSSNDGPGSGLDADLLDGYHASSFALLNSSPTFNIVTATGYFEANATYPHYDFYDSDAGTNLKRWQFVADGGQLILFMVNDAYSASNAAMTLVRTGYATNTVAWANTTAFTIAGNTVWTSGNDGSGSGLDADLWDGNNFATYLNQAVLSSSSPVFAGIEITGGNGYFVTNDAASRAIAIRAASGGSNARLQFTDYAISAEWGNITATASSMNIISAGTVTINTYTAWHAGNDGAGSGLDADLLDGYNVGTSGGAIPLLNGTNTWSGTQTMSALTARVTLVTAVSGTLTTAHANVSLELNGNVTLPNSVFTAGDKTVFDPGTAARTFTRGSGIAMYVNGTDVASATLAANQIGGAHWRSSSVVVLTGAFS